eukprot:m.17305 g.17305  ORF g.17305 m.17305 type:complete len:64 (-) comp7397_c0_seq2:7-198(-)
MHVTHSYRVHRTCPAKNLNLTAFILAQHIFTLLLLFFSFSLACLNAFLVGVVAAPAVSSTNAT